MGIKNLYRIVTFTHTVNSKDDWDGEIHYSTRLNYGLSTTAIKQGTKYNTYRLKVDRNTGKLDSQGKLIFENDIIQDPDKNYYAVLRDGLNDKFVYINLSTGKPMNILKVDDTRWKLVTQIYWTTLKLDKIDKKLRSGFTIV